MYIKEFIGRNSNMCTDPNACNVASLKVCTIWPRTLQQCPKPYGLVHSKCMHVSTGNSVIVINTINNYIVLNIPTLPFENPIRP